MTWQKDPGSDGTESRDVPGDGAGTERAPLERVLDAAPTAIVVLDDEARVERVNQRAAEILDLSGQEHRGRPVDDLGWEPTREDGTPLARSELTSLRALADGEEHRAPAVVIRGSDGQTRTLSVASRPVFDDADGEDDAEVSNVVVAFTDVSKRRESQRELEAKNAELERFAGVLSHDLRGPLSVAQGSLALTRETGDLSYLDAVGRAHDRMFELVDDLLLLARRGDSIGQREPVNLADIARTAWETVDPGHGEVVRGGDILEATTDASLVVDATGTVLADESRLHQLLENLFRNAAEHAGPEVAVRVVDLPGGGFAVEDDGPGLDPDDAVRLFDPATRRGGLGLSIVGAIAEGHGWEVAVGVSEAGGTRIEFQTDPDDGGGDCGAELRGRHHGRSDRDRGGRSHRDRGGHNGRSDRDRGDADT